jgi:hypothetical protein
MSYTPSPAVPLTDTQKADVRRHLGYSNMMSDDNGIAPYYRFAELEALNFKLDNLREEENKFVTTQLNNINTAYNNYITAQANLATLSVSIIQRNPNELPMRYGFYCRLSQDLASWIGVDYRGMGSSGATRVII